MILRFHGLKVTDFIAENLTVHGWDGEKSFLSLSTPRVLGIFSCRRMFSCVLLVRFLSRIG